MNILDRPPIPMRVPLAPAFRPPVYRPRLAQPWIEVKPQIQIQQPKIEAPVSIQLGLGSLPLSIGLFAGAGVAFLVRSGVPEGWPQTVATVVGAGLAVGGIANLIIPPKAPHPPPPAAPAAPPGPPPPPSGAAAPEEKPAGFTPPSVPAFTRIQLEVVSPKPDQEIKHTGWFLVGDKIPVVIRMYNPTDESVTVNLEFEWDEFPGLIGYTKESHHGSKAFQVTLAAKEQRNDTFELPVQSGSSWTSLNVALAIYKKRMPEENRFLLQNLTFTVT